jgi:hypothetical protein
VPSFAPQNTQILVAEESLKEVVIVVVMDNLEMTIMRTVHHLTRSDSDFPRQSRLRKFEGPTDHGGHST